MIMFRGLYHSPLPGLGTVKEGVAFLFFVRDVRIS